jgi:prepilin-type N-terminal cleavage/methylation domain-containing protein
MSLLNLKSYFRKSESGFTLTEILITVAIVGILASIAVPVYNGYVASSKRKTAEAVIEQIPMLLETYRAENGRFPPDGTYTYTETDAGVKTDTISTTAGLTDFKPRSESYPASQGILYHYTITIANSGTNTETATYQASPQTSRGAPSGDVPSPAATYK